jgi:hypothetical protein
MLHAGLLAWELADPVTELPVMRLPSGSAIAATGTLALLAIFLISAFARRSALSFAVVPSMLVAGVAAHAVSTAADRGLGPATLSGLLGFGSLAVAICLSFGASAIAARGAPSWNQQSFTESSAFRVGALALLVVLGIVMVSKQSAPIAAICAAFGVIAIGAMQHAVARDGARSSAPGELVSAVALALGAVWSASIVSGSDRLVAGSLSSAATAMQFAWLASLPVLLAGFVALAPHLRAVGVGVKRGRSTVLTTAIGALTSVGLCQVVFIESKGTLLAAPLPTRATRAPTPRLAASRPTSPPELALRTPAPESASAAAEPSVTPSSTSVVEPDEGLAPEGEALALSYESDHARLTLQIRIDGPMLPKDAVGGVRKTMKRLVRCYEKSEHQHEPLELRMGLLINEEGSVKQAEPIDTALAGREHITCMQLAFYRSGFMGPPKLTWLEAAMAFGPKG